MQLVMRFPGGLKKALTFSYDDGPAADGRLIDIMVKNGILGTFNLNGKHYVGKDPTKCEFAKKVYSPNGMEIAGHGFCHPFYSEISAEESEKDIKADKNAMKTAFGLDVRGFAYPYNSFNETTIELLKKYGYVYSRTCFATNDFILPDNPLCLNPTCHHSDENTEELLDKFLAEEKDEPRMYYLWGHSYEFDDADNWDFIEKICEKAGHKPEIWYATNIDIVDYLYAFRSLKINSGSIKNNSDKRIWVSIDGKETVIEPHSEYEI